MSDQTGNSRGFNIEYKPVHNSCDSKPRALDRMKNAGSSLHPVQMLASSGATDCEERHSELEFEIKSRNFPGNYSHNLDCVHYVVRASDDVCGLELRFITFNLEESEGCAYDFLEVDGESFCGRLPNGSRNIFRFDSAVKTISFQTDSQVSAAGFHIKVRQLKDCSHTFMPVENAFMAALRTQKCSIALQDREGKLTSFKYPEPYPGDLLCVYAIERNPQGHFCSADIHFGHFELQDSVDCNSDFLELENKRYCGKALHQTSRRVHFDDDGNVRFLFKSDSSGPAKAGFILNYTQIECKDSTGSSRLDSSESNFTSVAQSTLVAEESKGARNSKNRSYFYQEPCYHLFTDRNFTIENEKVGGKYKENESR